MKNKFVLLYVVIGFLCTSCEKVSESTRSTDEEHLMLLSERIDAYVKDVPCTGTEEWLFAAIGAKACGGPTHYIAYPKSIDVKAFLALVSKFTEAQKAFNKKYNAFSDCRFVSPPIRIDCVKGKPVLIQEQEIINE
ncbi:hypothetical protein [Sphingobacterium sp. LRF_L2]|uniref:hypothetical protein n=1 Tax=Sphingobacterium sp. LRF_L2 TaxID=3369421 RepID=UPI003F62CCFF